MAKAYLVEDRTITSYIDGKYGYSPSKAYPEYPWNHPAAKVANPIYDLVRQCLLLSGYDREHAGTKDWNPLGHIIKEGNTVLIKPNWVEDRNKNPRVHDHLASLVTNPSVLRPIIDYVAAALKGTGRIILADAPMQGCDLQHMFKEAGYQELFSFYEKVGLKLEVMDLRKYHVVKIHRGVVSKQVRTENSAGSLIVEMGSRSLHTEKDAKYPEYKVSDYAKADTAQYHRGHHAYEINGIALKADVVVNVPKPKTHRLAGMTAAMKNFVGITYEKASLPHRVIGDKAHGGDAYEKPCTWKRWMEKYDEKNIQSSKSGSYRKAKLYDLLHKACYAVGAVISGDKYRVGSWYGNDTIWRTLSDLNTIMLYADKNGQIQETPQRRIFSIGDMVICGEGEGPIGPSPKPLGMILMAENNLLFDRVMCEIMGFDAKKIQYISNRKMQENFGYREGELEQEILRTVERESSVGKFASMEETHFRAHSCWVGKIEKKKQNVSLE